MRAPNRNLLWAKIVVDELARGGLREACIAPGSRSTPLAIAFAEQPEITVYSHIDERSAAFFALGLALANERPVAVLCSSGTATANFFPAIIEAYHARVPLLILTADRPHELRASGANQTVDQVKLYGDQVLWSFDVALPEGAPAPAALRSLRTLAARALATAGGMPRGPVHLNFPFRKPLEPTLVSEDVAEVDDPRPAGIPFTRWLRGQMAPSASQIALLADALRAAKHPLIICGPRCPSGNFVEQAARLARASGAPLIADPLSGLRFGPQVQAAPIIGGYDLGLRAFGEWPLPDLVVQFGAAPASQSLEDYLSAAGSAQWLQVSEDGTWLDPNHRSAAVLHADPALLCAEAARQLEAEPPAYDATWLERWQVMEEAVWSSFAGANTDNFFDGAVVAAVAELLPDPAALFVASSLPVRHLEAFARPSTKRIRVFANRGASGIDGTISSALGVAAASDVPLTLVTGDLAFYHDMNGLLAIRRCAVPATIVVINNDGGGIFYRLPVSEFDPPFTELFVTPHGLTFEHAAELYGLHYVRADERLAFERAFRQSQRENLATLIEVRTDARHDLAQRTTQIARLRSRILPEINL
ncbi:MAG: 2-succinyl-5-enolpyruvyl-6-hydroxy-3-cyclohexene-1-carboxylic-acid synthase [Aggregatilineales bacterium]